MSKAIYFFIVGSLVLGILAFVLVQQNYDLTKSNLDLKANNYSLSYQIDSYKVFDLMNKVPMYTNGDGGRFLPEQSLFYVRTTWGAKQSCLNALHEIGHSIQWKNNNPCFYDKNNLACEEGAVKYTSDNAWRCEGLK